MTESATLTHRQSLVDFCADYGIPKIRLRANEEFVGGKVDGFRAYVTIERWTVVERSRDNLVTGHSVRVEVWANLGDTWRLIPGETVTVADPNWEPVKVSRFSVKSFREQIESLRWARDCANPGTDRFPMAAFGHPDDNRMPVKHWSL